MQKAGFDKKTTAAIKGIALILMFIHHFFAYPEWYVEGISYPELDGYIKFFRCSLKICVPVFAFLTGYFYAYGKKKTLYYSLRKITDLLVSYWTVYIPILLFALLTGYRGLSAFGFLLGIFGRNQSIMTFCWYVSFYCLAMLLLPLCARMDKPALVRDTVLLVIIPIVASTILEMMVGSDTLRTMIEEIRLWFPCVASGYICSKYKVFDAVEMNIGRKAACVRVFIYGACICFAIMGRYFCDSLKFGSIHCLGEDWIVSCTMDVFYAPIFVYGVSMLLREIEGGYIFEILRRIGDRSLLMWFIHCIFFNVSNEITQRILYWPKHPVLVVIFGLLICYMGAWIISPVEKRLIQLKNCMLERMRKA